MATAVILSNTPQPSFRIIGDLFSHNFREAGVKVVERDVPSNQEQRAALNREFEGQKAVFFHNVAIGRDFQTIPGAINVGLPAYEFSRVYDSAVRLLNKYDELWVTTSHVGDVLQDSGATVPILRMPPALDRGNFPQKADYSPHKPFRFLFVGEPHFRKGAHFLMHGFVKAFPNAGSAELIIKTGAHHRWTPLREDIRLISDWLSTEAMRKLYAESDCYISASLAEGLGLPIAEAILCGTPVCANYWGGHRDLLADGGFFPLKYFEADRPWTGEPQFYTPGQKCAISNEASVAEAMRKIVDSSPARRQRMAARARESLLQSYGSAALRPLWAKEVARLWKMQNQSGHERNSSMELPKPAAIVEE